MTYAVKLPLADRCNGKWKGILEAVGFDRLLLDGKHHPCPFCGGRDRFRWTNVGGTGAYWCNVCGTSDGIDLVQKHLGCNFAEAAKRVESLIGDIQVERKTEVSSEVTRKRLSDLWKCGAPITEGSPAALYLRKRGYVGPFSKMLRQAPTAKHHDGESYPSMLAAMIGPESNCVNVQRTWLTDDGHKAPVDVAKVVQAASIPKGTTIKLFPVTDIMGVAEGVETALMAGQRFGVPTWATYSAQNLMNFTPPDGVTKVLVFGDNDESFTGQAAAFELARKLTAKKITVEVHLPSNQGSDWADV